MKSFELHEQPGLPPGWALISELTLHAAAYTYSSTTEITPSKIIIRGVTTSAEELERTLSQLEKTLLPGMELERKIEEIRLPGSFYRQCVSVFRTASRGRKIEFPRASAALGTSASPYLDELIQIAVDCPKSIIRITGHTDNTGEESNNVALSQARADEVAAYLISGGLAATRLVTKGAGSSRPLVDGGTPQAHQLNRRIDIQMILPDN
ncbi:MAG: OmpA family protein [Proteobacteria bacterium]|nr:OmpA family protein [Pseudomonadota bacterium]